MKLAIIVFEDYGIVTIRNGKNGVASEAEYEATRDYFAKLPDVKGVHEIDLGNDSGP
jgi:hypothetical protein